MGNPKGFLLYERKEAGNRPVSERLCDFGEVEQTLNAEDRKYRLGDAWIAVFHIVTGDVL